MTGEKLSPNEIKVANRQLIYGYIRSQESVSKQDIVVALQLSLPTVTQNLQYLKKHGLIDTSKKITNTGGRNATAYTYIHNAKQSIGISLTGHHINAVAVDLSGTVVSVVKERILFNLNDESYLKRIGEVIEQVKLGANISDENLLGVGIAVPGLVTDDGEYVNYGSTLNFTGETRPHIAKYIPYRNRLFHDSYAAGYAEAWGNHEMQNAFYISLSSSVGGSVIIDNKIYIGDSYKGGEIGHMIMVPENGEQCYCGKRGCFDTLCRATKLDSYTEGNLEEFFRLLKNQDNGAKERWKTYVGHLALAIHNIRMLFDGGVILGGHVGAYVGDFMEDLYKQVNEKNPFGDQAEDFLTPCRYTVEAAAAGAAMCYIDEFISSI